MLVTKFWHYFLIYIVFKYNSWNKVMFADKLQNPFLKPSPFASSTSYVPSYTPSYNLPPFPSSAKYNSFKTYEESNTISYQPSSYQAPLSYNSK